MSRRQEEDLISCDAFFCAFSDSGMRSMITACSVALQGASTTAAPVSVVICKPSAPTSPGRFMPSRIVCACITYNLNAHQNQDRPTTHRHARPRAHTQEQKQHSLSSAPRQHYWKISLCSKRLTLRHFHPHPDPVLLCSRGSPACRPSRPTLRITRTAW